MTDRSRKLTIVAVFVVAVAAVIARSDVATNAALSARQKTEDQIGTTTTREHILHRRRLWFAAFGVSLLLAFGWVATKSGPLAPTR
jgi:hypothetical protein